MHTAHKLLPLLLLAAMLHTAHAQQTTNPDKATKTKVKTKRAASATGAAAPVPDGAPLPLPGAPAGPEGPGGPGGPHAGRGPHRPGGPLGRPQALREVKTYSGTLTSYATNPEGLYDGFLTNINGTATQVHFPPHMAKALMAATKPGQTVKFEAVAGPGFPPPASASATASASAPRLELVSVGEGAAALQLTPPVRPEATAAAATATTVSGTITQLRTDARGQLRGMVLSDNTLLLVPPHVGEQLADKLKVGASIQATALSMPQAEGVVAADALRRLRTQTLTINGTRFLVN
ncbi:hypothetical protein [Hymenobacter rigui]|uniref:hypothetical protein n=1 Tax=Hymenobacter rigui TaxID=334424 RepID=UPI001476F932|nr:hypothetical protein [Hymenobacter rigui]